MTATATVTATGTGTPTGSIDFAMEGVALGNVPLTANVATATAPVTFSLYNFGFTGPAIVSATIQETRHFLAADGLHGRYHHMRLGPRVLWSPRPRP